MTRIVELRNTGDNYRAGALVGTGLWNDGDDATSTTITETGAERNTHGWIEPLVDENPAEVLWIGVRWRMSAATSGTPMVDVNIVHNGASGGGGTVPFTELQARILGFTADGAQHDYFHEFTDVDYANMGVDMVDVATRLTQVAASAGPRALRFFVPNTSPAQTYVIAEGWIELGFPDDDVTVLRRYPRDDAYGFGNVKRNYPPPRRHRNYGQQP